MYLRIRNCTAADRTQVHAIAALSAALADAGVTLTMALAIIEDRPAHHPNLADAAVADCIEQGIDAALALLPPRARKKARFQLVVTGCDPSTTDKE